jgi:phospholipid transport system substrate-binding protein
MPAVANPADAARSSAVTQSKASPANAAPADPAAEDRVRPATPVAAVAPPVGEARAPQDVVEHLHGGLLEIMRNADALGFDGRKRTIEPVLNDSFDFAALTVGSVGRIVWSGWSDDERRAYARSFRAFTIATYASQFDGFSGQSFETGAVEDGPGGTKLVKTLLVRPKGEPIELHYLLRQRKDSERWAVIDIFLKGSISELARQRSQFGAVLKREGFSALVAALEAKTASFASESTSEDVGLGHL